MLGGIKKIVYYKNPLSHAKGWDEKKTTKNEMLNMKATLTKDKVHKLFPGEAINGTVLFLLVI